MSALMKLKELESYLQSLDGFPNPKVELEQYETPAHIAAISLHTIQTQYGDLEGNLILDAGCGPGVLGLGSVLLGAGSVVAVDIDFDALSAFICNANELEITNVDVLQCDILQQDSSRWENCFDTVIMNPPFGTKNNAGIDMKFLRKGVDISSCSIYSLHKSTTRTHIKKKVKDWGVEGDVIAELRYNLPSTYKFHRQQTRDIAVDLWRLQHPHT